MRGVAGYTQARLALLSAQAATSRWKTLTLAAEFSGLSLSLSLSLSLCACSAVDADCMPTADAAAQRADGDGELMTLNGILPVDLSSGTKYAPSLPLCLSLSL